MTVVSGSPVEPKVFDLLDAHLALLAAHDVDTTRPVRRNASIIVFCETFFQQFFESHFGYEVRGLNETSKGEAARLRVGVEVEDPLSARLVASFEELCDFFPDLTGFEYGGSASEFQRFHHTYVPRLLRRIEEWAREHHHVAILERVMDAIPKYDGALG